MYKLIYMDIKLLINYFVIAMPVSIFFVAFTYVYPAFGYAMGAFGIAGMFAISAPSMGVKNHTDIVLNSLPVLRSEIILSKYLSAFVYTIIGILMMTLAGLLVKASPLPFHIPYMNWQSIVIAFISMSFLISIYYPLFYWLYNNLAIVFVNMVFFYLIFFMPSFISTYIKEHMNETLVQHLLQLNLHTPWALPLLGITIALMLLIISYLFTVKIYSAKDF